MQAVNNFQAEVERKLFTHNLGHACMGYIGYLKGYSYIHETFSDEYLLTVFNSALYETSQALLKLYPDDLDPDEHREVIEDIQIRFANPLIMDSVNRVARDPIRKLGPTDRLIGSAKLCIDQEIFPQHIACICGAAMCYDYPEDDKAIKLQKLIKKNGPLKTLEDISKIDSHGRLGSEIIAAYKWLTHMKKEWNS